MSALRLLSVFLPFQTGHQFTNNLLDALMGGDSIDEFLDDFPTVKLEQIRTVLKEAEHAIEDLAAA